MINIKFVVKLRKTATRNFILLHEAYRGDVLSELMCLNVARSFQKEERMWRMSNLVVCER